MNEGGLHHRLHYNKPDSNQNEETYCFRALDPELNTFLKSQTYPKVSHLVAKPLGWDGGRLNEQFGIANVGTRVRDIHS